MKNLGPQQPFANSFRHLFAFYNTLIHGLHAIKQELFIFGIFCLKNRKES